MRGNLSTTLTKDERELTEMALRVLADKLRREARSRAWSGPVWKLARASKRAEADQAEALAARLEAEGRVADGEAMQLSYEESAALFGTWREATEGKSWADWLGDRAESIHPMWR